MSAPAPVPVRSSPVPGPVPGSAPLPFPLQANPSAEIDSEPYERQLATRNSRAGLLAIGIVAGLLAAGGAYFYMGRTKSPPPELVSSTQQLFPLIEDDGTPSLEKAKREFANLAASSPPNYLVPKADQLIATAFLAADLRDQAFALQEQFSALELQRKQAEEDHSRADWRSLVNNAIEQMNQVKAKIEPLQARAAELDAEQSKLVQELNAARANLDGDPPEVDRAFGVYFALKGTDNGPRFAGLYRNKVPNDGWADLILAASTEKTGPVADPLRQRLAAAQAALKANPRLTRAKRIEARLQLALRDFAAARDTATELSLQSPDDPRVRQLLSAIESAEKVSQAAP